MPAVCVGPTVNAVRSKNNKLTSARFAHADLLAKALKLDMKDYFEPNAENYFTKVGKPQIIEALQEVEGTLPTATMKKSDMAKMAEHAVAGKGWLPKLLR